MKFKTLREASEFWDTHDAATYWDETRETLINLWLKEKLLAAR